MRRFWPLLLVIPGLVGEILVFWFGLTHRWYHGSILTTEVVALVCFGVALVGIWRYRGPRSLLIILLGCLALQVSALHAGPVSSDDVYRYAWDGKVQLSGTDPYRYPPSAPELDHLRDHSLFPQDKPNCAWQLPDGRCSRVNRPDVRTIYPPVAEGAFTLGRLFTFNGSDGPFPMQVFGALGVLAVAGLLAWRSRRLGQPIWAVALWAWCPVTAVEAVNNGHIDWLAALFTLLGLLAYRERRSGLAGALIGAAIATKLYPALVLPAMLRRHPIRTVGAAVGLVALSYVPHVLAVGGKVIGYLPGYLKEENYSSGTRFLLLGQVIPLHWLTKSAVLVMLAVVAWAIWRSDPDRPEYASVVLVGVGLLVTTPTYSWYVLSLLVLVAMTRHVEWLALVIGPTIANLAADGFSAPINFRESCYAIGLACAALGILARAVVTRRRLSLATAEA